MNLKPLPENGSKADFKHAVFSAIPPRPFFHRQPILRDRNLFYCIITNGTLAFNNLVIVAVDVYCQDATFINSGSRIAIALLEVWMIRWTYRTARRTENSLEKSFYQFVDHLQHLELCPRNSPDTYLEVLNTHRQMANMMRRRNRTLGTRLKVGLYNLLHRNTQKCNCCLQVRLSRCELLGNKKKQKVENCPFCSCDY